MSLLHGLEVTLGAVRSASALPLAGILPRVLFVAAALALAVVLTFACVLRQVLVIGCYRNTSKCRGDGGHFGVSGNRLGVETGSRAAEKAGEGRGQDKVVYIVDLHEEFLSSVGHRTYALGYWLLLAAVGLEESIRISTSASYLAACLKLREANGYIVSRVSQKGIVLAARIAPWCCS